MRITNSMITSNFLQNMNSNLNRMERHQSQLMSGRRLTRLSDDPVGVLKSMAARVKLYRIDRYEENLKTARTTLTQAETNLMEVNSILKSAYETAVQITSDSYTSDDKEKTAAFIQQMRDQLLDLGNGQNVNQYIFAGYGTSTAPFTVDTDGYIRYKGLDMTHVNVGDADYAALMAQADQEIQVEIGNGIYTNMTITGLSFMGTGDDNIYNIMQDFYTQLQDPNVKFEDLSPFITKFQDAQSRIMGMVADVGGRQHRLDLVESRYEEDFLTYTDMKSRVEDIDEAEAIMYFKMANNVYLSCLNVGAQLMQTSLLNYIK